MPRVRASPTRLMMRLAARPPAMEPAAWMPMSAPKNEGGLPMAAMTAKVTDS